MKTQDASYVTLKAQAEAQARPGSCFASSFFVYVANWPIYILLPCQSLRAERIVVWKGKHSSALATSHMSYQGHSGERRR